MKLFTLEVGAATSPKSQTNVKEPNLSQMDMSPLEQPEEKRKKKHPLLFIWKKNHDDLLSEPQNPKQYKIPTAKKKKNWYRFYLFLQP